MARASHRIIALVARYRWPLGLLAAALAVRVVWALAVHPPHAFVYSDMLSYYARALRFSADPWGGPWPDEPFYPWGTHYLLGTLILVVGKSSVTLGAAWAALNAPIAPLAYLLAGRLHGGPTWSASEHRTGGPVDDPNDPDERVAMSRAVARVAGLFMVVYYPALSYAGYFLSESPFMVLVTASAFFALRLADGGRTSDALWLGVTTALGFAVRPQLLAAAVMLFGFFVWRRRAFPALRPRHAAAALAPLLVMLAFSSSLSLRHTGRLTPLPHNGAVNRVFGRCHNLEIRSSDAMFGPPSFGALQRYEDQFPDAWFKLEPALGPKLSVPGRIIDEGPLHDLADRCIEASGTRRQLYYAATHVVLLWGYHVAWPDMAQVPFRFHMRGWTRAHLIVFAIPALIAMAMGGSSRWPRHGVVAIYLWSLFAVTMLFMGAARFRVPYDVLSVVLGLDVYGRAAVLVTRWWRRHLGGGDDATSS